MQLAVDVIQGALRAQAFRLTRAQPATMALTCRVLFRIVGVLHARAPVRTAKVYQQTVLNALKGWHSSTIPAYRSVLQIPLLSDTPSDLSVFCVTLSAWVVMVR